MTLRLNLLADFFLQFFSLLVQTVTLEDFCISSITSLNIHNYHYKNKLKSSFSGQIQISLRSNDLLPHVTSVQRTSSQGRPHSQKPRFMHFVTYLVAPHHPSPDICVNSIHFNGRGLIFQKLEVALH